VKLKIFMAAITGEATQNESSAPAQPCWTAADFKAVMDLRDAHHIS
jgi:hypothetical protein